MKSARWMVAFVIVAGWLLASGCARDVYKSSLYRPTTVQGSELAEEVSLRLQEDDVAGKYAFSVVGRGDKIILRGSVPDDVTRMRAVGIALGTPGVEEVVDELDRW